MTRQDVFSWCRRQYGTEPDYPWNDWNAVLRHTDNNKWYGVIIEVDRSKLGTGVHAPSSPQPGSSPEGNDIPCIHLYADTRRSP